MLGSPLSLNYITRVTSIGQLNQVDGFLMENKIFIFTIYQKYTGYRQRLERLKRFMVRGDLP
jgi:hypothetical protein